MYCHKCGAKAFGDFCSNCGAKIIRDNNYETIAQDWSNETRYSIILLQPTIRDLIAQYASQAQKRMTGEEFLELCDKASIPLTGVPLSKIAAIVQPIYAAIGIKTGKTRKQTFAAPTGKVIVATLCSMARNGQLLNKVEQGQDGCLFHAKIPSDIWSFAGDLLITIQQLEYGTFVESATVIKGQLYDWGKSENILTKLFDDIKGIPV